MRSASTIFWLSIKELRSFLHDWVLLALVVYSFSLAIIAQAQSSSQELHNASIGIVDEDRSELSRRILRAFLPPHFKTAEPVNVRDVGRLMDAGRYTFIVDIPPRFERDVVAGRRPALQVTADATALMQAGIGLGYAQEIIAATYQPLPLYLAAAAIYWVLCQVLEWVQRWYERRLALPTRH